MVLVEDLKKMGEDEEPRRTEKPTLLSKYQIPVQNLDFDYVENCQNGKELEKILHILNSGEEGYFPDLIKATESQLTKIKPNSKFLRKADPVLNKAQINQDEWEDLSKDLAGWVDDVNKKDHELEERKIKSDIPLSEIRKTSCYKITENKTNPKRISATDYDSWNKYDPDTEILKMDLEDEKLKKEALKGGQKVKTSKSVKFNNFATEAEAIFEANREKERGNECFKANEYQNALQHYTNSLECKPLAVVYTNRALIYNKLKKYKKAIEDCKASLKIEPNNFKAHLRMAQSYDGFEQYHEALECTEDAIQIDPNNTIVQQLANKLRNKCGKMSSNTRLMIEDVQSNESKPVLKNETQENSIKSLKSILKTNKNNETEEKRKEIKSKIQDTERNVLKNITEKSKNKKNISKNYEVIAIPGTSTMPPPYFKVVYSKDPEVIKREKEKILYNRPILLHITSIDVASDEEYQKDCNEMVENICSQNCKEKKKSKRSTSIKIKDDLESYQLENFKFNDEEETIKENHKQTWKNIREQKSLHTNTKIQENNNKGGGGGGEPCNEEQQFIIPTAEELQAPYTFIETWNAVRKDSGYTKQAEILKKMDFNRIHNVIGYKLDDTMLSIIINCLYKHFMVPGELDRLYSALENLIRIPRFNMMSMFLEESDLRCISQLIQFLDQHGRSLPSSIKDIYCNK